MRAVRYHDHGGPEVLRVEEVPDPAPGPTEVLVDVHAASVNPVDTSFREGSDEPSALPMIPGSDLAGVVAAVGEGVTRFRPGDRVFGTGLGHDRQGTYAERAVAPEDCLSVLPAGISFVEGAAVALVGVTAWRALVARADLDPGECCLVHGGNGGVGHVAVQLAASTGARVVTTARPEYHGRLSDFGADATLDYRRDDLADAIREAGAPDVVFDHRLDDYLSLDAAVATQGARVAGVGDTATTATLDDVPAARGKELAVHLLSVFNTPDVARVLDRLARLVAAGDVVPDVAGSFGLESAPEAQRTALEDSFFGKLVVEP